MKKLTQLIKEELLKQVQMVYDKNGNLTKLDKIQDLEGAIQRYQYLIQPLEKKVKRNKDHLDRRQLWQYKDDIKLLKKQLNRRKQKRKT